MLLVLLLTIEKNDSERERDEEEREGREGWGGRNRSDTLVIVLASKKVPLGLKNIYLYTVIKICVYVLVCVTVKEASSMTLCT